MGLGGCSWCRTKTWYVENRGTGHMLGAKVGSTAPNQGWHGTLRILNSYVAFQVLQR